MVEETANLGSRIPAEGTKDPDSILDLFLEWAADAGFELYAAQEEALLELMADRHVVLDTPTGSGKSLVALGLHFRGLCEGKRSFYTSPIKALASEKFFALCAEFGADNVGMLTGDASINPDASVICCTAEVLANLALRKGEHLDAPFVVMDEFHYYADRDRGWAWQVPLITLPNTRFLLMSATLGDMSAIMEHIEKRTGCAAALVHSDERPVPLDYHYRETPLHETIEELMEADRAPIYLVNFTQRDCAEMAQKLTSMKLTTKEEKAAIRSAVGDARFDTPYGKEFKRFLGFGIGVHHAGLLPKYRLQVEQLAQRGLLKVISGTDTLGVGINIPLRTVLFTKLAKFDGRKVTRLKVREFKQISGRAGRKGFDDEGLVVSQAPEETVERLRAQRKAAANPKKRHKKGPKKAQPGEVSWSEETFKNLVANPPEKLSSHFWITPGMLVDLLQRDAAINDPESGNFASVRRLIADCHDDDAGKQRHLERAAQLARSLYRAGIIRMERDTAESYFWVTVDDDLQVDFSLFHNLSLFLIGAIDGLDSDNPEHALDFLSLVEAVLEDPVIVIRRQVDRIKTELINRLKAEGVSYDERMNRLDEVTHPQPIADYIHGAFDHFRRDHPWVGGDAVRPKSVAREMVEDYLSFTDYIRRYGLQRSEGVLLRYLSQVYKTLNQNVPDQAKTEGVNDIIAFLRATLERVDTSLIEEWESLRHPELLLEVAADTKTAHRLLAAEELRSDPKALGARLRADLHLLVAALARRDWEEAAASIRHAPEDPAALDSADDFEAAMAPFFEAFDTLVFNHKARLAEHTRITNAGNNRWQVVQILLDPDDENLWCIEGRVDLSDDTNVEGPLIVVTRIGT
ncbi:MAG: DEAD/DEAH box helicase [Thermoanaerobaculales bacterium]